MTTQMVISRNIMNQNRVGEGKSLPVIPQMKSKNITEVLK